MTQTSQNYLNELKPLEQLFHQACRTAPAAQPGWACGTPVRDAVSSQNVSATEEQPPQMVAVHVRSIEEKNI